MSDEHGEDTEGAAAVPVLEDQAPVTARHRAEAGHGVDWILLAAVLGLVGLGSVEVYSASAVYAAQKFGSPTYFLVRQLIFVALGLGAMALAAEVDYSRYRRAVYPLLVVALGSLAAVLVFGAKVNEARRWFRLGSLSFQPVELAKFALVTYLAYSLAKKQEQVRKFTIGFMPHLAVCGVMVVLLLKEPDLGSSIIMVMTTLILLFIAGTKISYLMLALLAATPIAYHSIVSTEWRLRRLLSYLDPWQFRRTTGYQITEALISIGSGGWTGLGLGDGKQKLGYMPEAHSDMILSNVGEELGFVGMTLVLSLFVIVLWRGVRAAARARDGFGTYVAAGLTTMFALQALVNTGVVLGALPAKGITLPFMSYGGTSLVVSMFFVGVILNVSRRAPLPAQRMEGRLANAANNKKKRRPVRVVVV